MNLEKFFSHVQLDIDSGCWNWVAGKTSCGYGATIINGKSFSTHRLCFEYFRGEVCNGLDLDHLCRNRGLLQS
jgi:hypothetical protein